MTTFAHRFAAAALIVSAGALGLAATANAQPNTGGGTSGEWDIGAYDFCMKNHPPLYTTEDVLDHHRWCCESTGGVWGSGDNGCHAPPAELDGPTDPFGRGAAPPRNIQAPPPPVDPTAPVHTGSFG